MGYYLLNWFLLFAYGVVVCGLGVFFIFLSNGKFDDVASWLYSSRNFLLIVIKGLSFFTTYKVLNFYKKRDVTFASKQNKDVLIHLFIFAAFAFLLRLFVSKSALFTTNTMSHIISLGLDFSLFLFLRKYYREFAWTDLLLISFTQIVVYFVIYQESVYLSLIGTGFFYFLYQYLNKWNNSSMVFACTLCGLFMFAEPSTPKQEMFFYFFALFSGFGFYLLASRLVVERFNKKTDSGANNSGIHCD